MALLPGSPAIGAGRASSRHDQPITTDQRGCRSTRRPDIGAFQIQTRLVVNVSPVDGTADDRRQLARSAGPSTWPTLERAPDDHVRSRPSSRPTDDHADGRAARAEQHRRTRSRSHGPAAGVTISGGGQPGVPGGRRGHGSFSGLTITGGSATGGNGGGLYNEGTATLTDCTISGNSRQARRRPGQCTARATPRPTARSAATRPTTAAACRPARRRR